MPGYLMLLAPSANRVYAGSAPRLAAAELHATCPGVSNVEAIELAQVPYLSFTTDEERLDVLARQSACFALFEREGDLLRPIPLPDVFTLDDDLVTIPKYHGKTNEQFTQLLLNVTLGAVTREADGRRQVLDPMSGRGTTLTTALRQGYDAYGVERDEKAFEAMAAYLKTYFRRKRMKHTANVTPVKRGGRSIGNRFDLHVAGLTSTVFTGDTRESAKLFGKKRFDAVVTDAPYGVVHGATRDAGRDRSPADLLAEAIPVWASQLKHGGALGIAWNTFGLIRAQLAELCERASLHPVDGDYMHRVDASIKRDILVAQKP